ncbi:unnamed protein product [Boreogadus saida]
MEQSKELSVAAPAQPLSVNKEISLPSLTLDQQLHTSTGPCSCGASVWHPDQSRARWPLTGASERLALCLFYDYEFKGQRLPPLGSSSVVMGFLLVPVSSTSTGELHVVLVSSTGELPWSWFLLGPSQALLGEAPRGPRFSLVPVSSTSTGELHVVLVLLVPVSSTSTGELHVVLVLLVPVSSTSTGELHVVLVLLLVPVSSTSTGELHVVLLLLVPVSSTGELHVVLVLLVPVSSTGELHVVLLLLVPVSSTSTGELHVVLVLLVPVSSTSTGELHVVLVLLVPVSSTSTGELHVVLVLLVPVSSRRPSEEQTFRELGQHWASSPGDINRFRAPSVSGRIHRAGVESHVLHECSSHEASPPLDEDHGVPGEGLSSVDQCAAAACLLPGAGLISYLYL